MQFFIHPFSNFENNKKEDNIIKININSDNIKGEIMIYLIS